MDGGNLENLKNKVRQFMDENPNWRENENWPLTQEQIDTSTAEFREKFSPERLRAMTDEEILRWIPFNVESQNDTMSYALEHSPVVGRMGGIGGGSAGKLGYYQGNDGNWKTMSNTITTKEDALLHRKIDIEVLLGMYEHIAVDNFVGLKLYTDGLRAEAQEDIVNNVPIAESINRYKAVLPGLVWVRKYFTVIFPDKFVEIYGKNFVRDLEPIAGIGRIHGDGADYDYSLWYSQMNKISNVAPDLGITNYELSRILWDFVYENGDSEVKVNTEIPANTNLEPTMGLNTIIYGPPGTGKTYSIKKIKEGILANQTSRYEGLIKGTVKDTLLFLYKSDNTSKTASDIWRDENFQKLQQYNGRTRSNSGAVYNELENNRDLFNRYEHDGRVIYNATENGLDYIRTKIEGQNNEPTPEADDFYEFITFHQSYGYEEFVEGIRAETNDSGNISYAVRDGVFKSFCRRAESDPENNYLFAIDEINRGNISKIFGELITLLEPDKRLGSSKQLVVTLPYSGEKFGVPKNVYVVGTMNTADRSIALLDIALRRRFDFMEVMPNLDLVSEDVDGVNVRELLASINSRIVEKIDRNHQIGHSYLMGVNNIGELSVAWYQRIIPLLQEYFYDDNNDLKDVIQSFINNDKVEILSGEDFKEALKDIYNENTVADPGIQL